MITSLRRYATFVFAALLLVLAGCSSVNTQPDEKALHYEAGPFSSVSFENCVDPGTRNYDGPSDKHYTYPAGQRTFEFSDDQKHRDGPAITVVSQDNVQMKVIGIATFSLNTDCKALQRFHERIGIKFGTMINSGKTTDDWRDLLNAYLRQPLDKAMDAASKQYGYQALFTDPAVKEKWETAVADLAATFIAEQAGADYFCSPGFSGRGDCGTLSLTIQSPTPPQKIIDALADQQAAIAENEAAKLRNKTKLTELEAIKAYLAAMGPAAYVEYVRVQALIEAIRQGKVQVIAVPNGGTVTVPTK